MRQVFEQQIGRYLALLEAMLAGTDESRRSKAILVLSSLVGALALARAVNDVSLSREFLAGIAQELKQLARQPVSD